MKWPTPLPQSDKAKPVFNNHARAIKIVVASMERWSLNADQKYINCADTFGIRIIEWPFNTSGL